MTAKTKKKNKYLPLVVLLVVLVALFAVYKALSASNDRKAAEEEAAKAAEDADIMIAEYDYTTMTSLSYQKKGGKARLRGVRFVLDLPTRRAFPA